MRSRPRRPIAELLEVRRLLSGRLSLDSTFGSGGFTTTPANTAALDRVINIAPDPNGGAFAIAEGSGRQVIHYHSDGSIDNSFGVDGRFILTFDDAGAIAVDSAGRVLVAGSNTVLRLTTKGDTDDSFGAGGFTALSSAGTFNDTAEDMIVSSGDSIVLLRTGSLTGTGPTPAIDAALVTHLDSSGDIQTSFSNDGTSVFSIPTAVDVAALSRDGSEVLFARQRGGLIVVTRTNDAGRFTPADDTIVSFASGDNLGGISSDALGDVFLVTDTPGSFARATLLEFDVDGNEIDSLQLDAPGATDNATAVQVSDSGKVLIGFEPYAISRVASDQIAPGVFLGKDGVLNVDGSAGNDTILVNRGSDSSQLRITRNGKRTFVTRSDVTTIQLTGRDGNDSLTVTVDIPVIATGDLGDDAITTAGGNDRIAGGDGNDFVDAGAGKDVITGGVGADKLFGGSGKDRIAGEGGKDVIHGGSGDDILDGGASDDRVFGDAGNDIIYGGRGNDILQGGSGTDQFFPGEGDDSVTQ